MTQVVNRLSEIETKNKMQIKKRLSTIETTLVPNSELFKYNGEQFKLVSPLILDDYTLKCTYPNNIVLLNNGKIFKICKIHVRQREMTNNLRNIGLMGFEGHHANQLFDYPTNSTNFGFNNIKSFSENTSWIWGTNIKAKCVMLGRLPHACTVSLLHSYFFFTPIYYLKQ